MPKGEGKKYGLRNHKPNKEVANQWQGTPQQEDFLRNYLNPKSETFANPYTSAIAAGYSEYYARVIAAPSINTRWLQEARDIIKLHPEHLEQALTGEALDRDNKAADRIRALELIGKMKGVFVEKKIVGHVNIEQILRDMK